MTVSADRPAAPAPLVQTGPPRRIVVRVLVTQLLLAALVGVAFVVMYAGLQRAPQPHDLPVAVVGSSMAREADRSLGASVAALPVRDDATARRLVRERRAIAAFSPAGDTLQVDVAGPNGLAENAAATALGTALARHAGLSSAIVDLKPLPRFDSRALGSFYAVLGVTVGSFILAQALYAVRMLAGLRAQLLTIVGFAVLVAITVAVVVGPWLQLLPVPTGVLIPVLALLSVAVSSTARALTAWFDSYGITAATLLMTAVGLSISGGIIGPDLLPQPLGTIGAVLPPGAGVRSVVGLGYFAAASAAPALAALVGWVVLGAGGMSLHAVVMTRRKTAATSRDASTPAAPSSALTH